MTLVDGIDAPGERFLPHRMPRATARSGPVDNGDVQDDDSATMALATELLHHAGCRRGVAREALLVGPSPRLRATNPQLLDDDQSLRTQHVEAIDGTD
jgi:hypothetical protein